MKILVTGANGYIGAGVVKQLLNDENEVIAVDLKMNKVDCRAIRIEANIFDLENPYEYLETPDIVLHLAWRDGFKHNSIHHINDLPKHYKFINNMIENGVKQICILGSMHEVGFFEGSINEETQTEPQSLYGISKNALRQAICLAVNGKGIIFQWIRGFYIVGNTEEGCSIFSKIAEAEHEGKKEFPFTMGVNQYDFIDYEQFCMQIAAVIEQTKVSGIINCCSGIPMRLGERVEKFIKDNDFSIHLKYGAFPDRPYDSKAVWGNNTKIKKILEGRKQ